jgi:hypothetical protein
MAVKLNFPAMAVQHTFSSSKNNLNLRGLQWFLIMWSQFPFDAYSTRKYEAENDMYTSPIYIIFKVSRPGKNTCNSSGMLQSNAFIKEW